MHAAYTVTPKTDKVVKIPTCKCSQQLRLLSEVDRELIAQALKSLFTLYKAGDIDGMVNLLAADIICFPSTSWGHARYPLRLSVAMPFARCFGSATLNI